WPSRAANNCTTSARRRKRRMRRRKFAAPCRNAVVKDRLAATRRGASETKGQGGPMHWIALVDHPEHVCCRYRLAAFRPVLEQAGHTLELLTIPCHWWSRVGFFHRLRGSNVIVQRRLLAGWQRTLLRRAARRLLFDFDDAV